MVWGWWFTSCNLGHRRAHAARAHVKVEYSTGGCTCSSYRSYYSLCCSGVGTPWFQQPVVLSLSVFRRKKNEEVPGKLAAERWEVKGCLDHAYREESYGNEEQTCTTRSSSLKMRIGQFSFSKRLCPERRVWHQISFPRWIFLANSETMMSFLSARWTID